MKKIIILILIFSAISSWAQPKLKRNGNSTLAIYSNSHPVWNISSKLNKWGKPDTLKLPFFDDFVSTKAYPDSTRWYNNAVFINNDFPVNPPSYGVATFDDLDSKGNPYQELNDQTHGPADTLLSLAINLKDSSGRKYLPSDSIYFSFFYQRQGLGDPSDSRDSIVLQFKDTGNNWKTVWKVFGGTVSPFSFVILGINDTRYFFKGFQFRYINFARHTGNMNQWHIDYIHLSANRRKTVVYYNDFAVQSRPTSLLKNYFEMPYDHYKADANNQKADTLYFNASNLNTGIMNMQARMTESHNGSTLVSTNFIDNAANVPAKGYARRRFMNYNFDNLTGSPVVIKREYELKESSGFSTNKANDKITVYQQFGKCYAYDDGTAEYGFGYDDDVLDPFYKGAIAYKFTLTKADTLWAVSMFFNRSVKSTSTLDFKLKVWKKISAVGTVRNADEQLFSLDALPQFTDSINGYHVFYLDTPIVLAKGDFYIGWEQVGNDHLDIGWDMNNGYHNSDATNNLFYADEKGNWQNYPSNGLKGALMMRPYVGKKIKLGPGNITPFAKQNIHCYPNPFNEKITLENSKGITKIHMFDLSGKLVALSNSCEINTSTLGAGIYILRVYTQNGEIFNQKTVKLQP